MGGKPAELILAGSILSKPSWWILGHIVLNKFLALAIGAYRIKLGSAKNFSFCFGVDKLNAPNALFDNGEHSVNIFCFHRIEY